MTKEDIKVKSIELALQIPINHKEYNGFMNQNIVSKKTTGQILADAKLINDYITENGTN